MMSLKNIVLFFLVIVGCVMSGVSNAELTSATPGSMVFGTISDMHARDKALIDKRSFATDAERVVWVGESFGQAIKPVKAVWNAPDGSVFKQVDVSRSGAQYVAKLSLKGKSPTEGRWQVDILASDGAVLDQQAFFIGKADIAKETSDAVRWTDATHPLKDESALVVFDRRELVLFDDYRSIERITRRFQILQDKGKEFGEVVVPFFQGAEKVYPSYAYTIDPDGNVIDAKEFQVQTFAAAYPNFTAFRYGYMVMPALTKGSVFEYQIYTFTALPKVDRMFFDSMSTASFLPTIEKTYSIQVPRNVGLKYYFLNTAVQEEQGAVSSSYRMYRFSRDMVPGLKREDLMPALRDVGGEVIVSTTESWDAVADWWRSLIKSKIVAGEDLKKVVKKVTGDATTDLDKIRRIYSYVSGDIRYVGLNFGASTYEPYTADMVLKNKYGDCKDQTMLLVAMLKESGIKSYTALVRSGRMGAVQQKIPSIGEFNHVIAVAEVDGKQFFLDPTVKNYPFGVLPSTVEDRDIMSVFDVGYRFDHIPRSASLENSTKNDMDIAANDDGSADVTLTVHWAGQEAGGVRHNLYLMNTTQQKDSMVDSIIKSVFPAGIRESYEFENVDDSNKSLALIVHFKVDSYLKEIGSNKYLISMLGSDLAVPAFLTKNRVYPVQYDYCNSQKMSIRITLPSKFRVSDVPPNFEITSPYFSSTIVYTKKDDRNVSLELALDHKAYLVPVADVGQCRSNWEKISHAHGRGIIVEKF